ncbi:MAG: hypothetical protein CL920_09135 [Deltaproteobacteria bacterium]|mgnify:CR=1 FL=1|nr:hypothetical protein [Deltaproteobacteria bacterium]
MFPIKVQQTCSLSRLSLLALAFVLSFVPSVHAENMKTLIDQLSQPKIHIRKDAIQKLGKMGPSAAKALPALLPLLKAKQRSIYLETINTLGYIKSEPQKTIPALIPFLYSDDQLGPSTHNGRDRELRTARKRGAPCARESPTRSF